MSPRFRTPIQEGGAKRLQRLKFFVTLIHLSMPEGMDRNEALQEYAAEVGVTVKKAEEHLELLENTGRLRWDDLRLYTTQKGLRYVGFVRDEKGDLLDQGERAEEEYRERKRKRAEGMDGPSHPKK